MQEKRMPDTYSLFLRRICIEIGYSCCRRQLIFRLEKSTKKKKGEKKKT
jgi:hypothetical protein